MRSLAFKPFFENRYNITKAGERVVFKQDRPPRRLHISETQVSASLWEDTVVVEQRVLFSTVSDKTSPSAVQPTGRVRLYRMSFATFADSTANSKLRKKVESTESWLGSK